MRRLLLLSMLLSGCAGDGGTASPSARSVVTDFLDARGSAVEALSVAQIASAYAPDFLYHCRTKAQETAWWIDLLSRTERPEFSYTLHRGIDVNEQLGYAFGRYTARVETGTQGDSTVVEYTRSLYLRRDNGVWLEYGGGSCP